MLALIDYGAGNLRSVQKALEAVGARVQRVSDPRGLTGAGKIVLPGVGSFREGMQQLRERNLVQPLLEAVASGKSFLGICLGMQLLFEEGEEDGRQRGLGLLAGRVRRFPAGELKVPHTGWNQLLPARECYLLEGLEPGAYAYFNHAYYCEAQPGDTIAHTEYGIRYASVVGRDRLYGVQFHPEKSQQVGLRILRNFVEAG